MIGGMRKERVLLLEEINRKAGEAFINGEKRSWKDAKQLRCLRLGDTREIWKYTIVAGMEDLVAQKLADVSWGCIIELTFSNKTQVQDVQVIQDIFADQIDL